jgi:flagellar hook-length control protein FliK
MNTQVNSYAVSPSRGDARGDGLMQWAPKMPQDRFANIPILANASEETRSDSNADSEGDLGTDMQREQDALNARRRDRSAMESGHTAGAVASDTPTDLPVQARSGAGKDDSTSARPSRTSCEESVTAESPGAEQKKQGALAGRLGKNGQHTQTAGAAGSKNGGFGAPAAGPSTSKGNLTADPQILDGSSQKALSRKQSPSLAASSGSAARLRGAGSESQFRAGSKRGVSGDLNPAMEALLSRGRETQPGGHKNGVSASPSPSASFVSPPAGAGPHTLVGTAAYGSVEVGAGESVSQSVGDQILDSLKASITQGDRQLLIRLQPPELGMVLVRLREQGERLEGTLKVERTDTRREIEQVLPEVVRSLQDAGIGIRRLDVTDSDSSGPDLGRGQPQQDGSSGHGDAGQDRDSLWTSSTSGPPATADSSWDSPRVPAGIRGSTAMPQGRIDVLL